MTRGILYIVWEGETEAPKHLGRSIDSIQKHHPGLPFEVVHFDPSSSLLDKSRMLDVSPFETTLFLDADTVVMGDLSHGFDKAEQHGLACCLCECPWARRYEGLKHRGELEEFNTGVLFFTKRMRPLFDEWKRLAESLNSAHHFTNTSKQSCVMPANDQASFALAVDSLEVNPWVLPLNWNFRPPWHHTFFGPLKIWHSMEPVPPALSSWVENAVDSEQVSCAEVRRPAKGVAPC